MDTYIKITNTSLYFIQPFLIISIVAPLAEECIEYITALSLASSAPLTIAFPTLHKKKHFSRPFLTAKIILRH